ncbi:MAG: Asp23/Gls24 family envelope stress response protein [Defluviitaleaceae bacterium]|nr:Asp23/Gls24 family envelope stress response protein [Defluviitaleaceae bacterium]
MAVKIDNDLGRINISKEAFAVVIGNATNECYGIVGMASKSPVKDGLAVVLGRDNFAKGVTITPTDAGNIDIEIYVVVALGVKVSEVCLEIQKKVRYVAEQTFGNYINDIHVFVQGIKGLE